MTEKKYSKSLFIFRRDLRLEDNTALLEACRNSEQVICCFNFDPKQVDKNPFKGDNVIQFMIESLEDVAESLESRGGKLYCFYGDSGETVKKLITQGVQAVYVNKDYTPFSNSRDKKIQQVCEVAGIDFCSYHDALLIEPEEALKADGTPYLVYTPFYKNASKRDVRNPVKNNYRNFVSSAISDAQSLDQIDVLDEENEFLFVKGGRKEALKLLSRAKELVGYDERRNIPADTEGTTKLSAHHKFGTLSIREVFHAIAECHGQGHTLIRELYWRDFFTHIAVHYPQVFGKCFYPHFDEIEWENDKRKFAAWCDGQTGFPIVDAGMRQLNTTGFMHNRVRMIVASFLTKDLHIDWRWGEKYFANKLVDYDPAVNNGNWQWAASTGCDAQPYFRIFNPWLQQKKFDPDCEYVKKWVPELADVPSSKIHKLYEGADLFSSNYPQPIVDHAEAKSIAEDMYGDVVAARKSAP